MARATLPAALALLVLVPFSGCFDAGSKDFDVIDAPRWSAGHTWTYALSQSMSEFGGGDDEISGDDDSRLVLTVFNTTEPLDGKSVYYARASVDVEDDGYLDSPFFEGEILAYAQDSLLLAGRGHSYPEYAMMAEPAVMYAEGSSVSHGPEYSDPCEGRARIESTHGHQSMPIAGFPLESGTLRGTWSPEENNDFAFDYVMDVEGLSSVTTRAGKFEAVHIGLAMSPSVRGAPEGFPSFRVQGDYWYAPSVEQFVLMELTASASGGFAGDSGSFRYESRAELVDFDLVESAEAPAPILAEPLNFDYRAFRIVSAVPLPQNAADGPVTARFAIEESSFDRPYEETVAAADSFPPTLPYDPEEYTVQWRLRPSEPRQGYESYVGDVFEYSFPTAGSYWLEAQLRPTVCGLPWLGSSSGRVSNYWERTWSVPVDPGLARAIPVDAFPVEYFPRSSTLQWSTEGTGLDGGHVALVDPTGQEQKASEGTDVNSLFIPGQWHLVWEAYGREVTYGVETPVVGDPVTVTLRIDYADPLTPERYFH